MIEAINQKKNILITGGLGFIGSHVRDRFINNSDSNVIVVDLPEKVNQCVENLDYELFAADISDWSAVVPLTNRKFDVIIHCAAQPGGRGGLENPQVDCDSNAKGTLNICELALRTGYPKIIYTSSVAVYGGGDDITEDTPVGPTSNYGISKLAGELYLQRYRHRGVDSVILRLFNTYGAGQDLDNKKQGVVSIFLDQLMSGNQVKMTGSPARYRDCIHVSDVVDAVMLVTNFEHGIDGALNVCSGHAVTMREIVNTLASIMKKKATIVDVGGYTGDQFGYYGNNERLCRLGWTPQFDLLTGFEKFYRGVIS